MPPATANPLLKIVEAQGYLVLDGGLATTLEARGHDLNDPLWSARVLLEEPDAVRGVHREFLAAGADCITSASYQASFVGFARRGLDEAESAALLRLSVDLACQARREFLAAETDAGRPQPLVAASIGPYGAFLADGSEYTGGYDRDEADLVVFHRDRWRILAATGADLLACETIPSLPETAALLSLLTETSGRWVWFSFSCRDGKHLNDGSPLADAIRLCEDAPGVAAVGINCTAPEHVASLIGEARRVTTLPVIVYPNLGEEYDAARKTWRPGSDMADWEDSVRTWREAGALGIGGCCRVDPRRIALIRRLLDAE